MTSRTVLTNALLALSLIAASIATAEDQPDVKVVDGVIHFFPSEPKDGMIVNYQVPGKRVWVRGVRSNGKTRQVRIFSVEGARGTKTQVKFRYPFGTDSATWNLNVKRHGDIVSVDIRWVASLIGELTDARKPKKLGVTGPASKHLPVLYSSGDSISLGCWPYLEGELWKEVNVYYQRELWKDIPSARSRNNGHAHLAYACLRTAYKSKRFKPDYMMVNFGLHMIATHKNKPKEYGQCVRRFIELAKTHHARFIWVTTTPYGSFRAKQNITIKQFNTLACRIAAESKVPVIDLHAWVEEQVKKCGEKKVYTDGVHLAQDVTKRQAKFMAKRIREIIQKKAKGRT